MCRNADRVQSHAELRQFDVMLTACAAGQGGKHVKDMMNNFRKRLMAQIGVTSKEKIVVSSKDDIKRFMAFGGKIGE